jgi:hypothetical protein
MVSKYKVVSLPNFINLNLSLISGLSSAAYAIVVRSSEYDLPKEMLEDIVSKSISRFATGNDGHGHDVRPLARRQMIDDASVYEGENS